MLKLFELAELTAAFEEILLSNIVGIDNLFYLLDLRVVFLLFLLDLVIGFEFDGGVHVVLVLIPCVLKLIEQRFGGRVVGIGLFKDRV